MNRPASLMTSVRAWMVVLMATLLPMVALVADDAWKVATPGRVLSLPADHVSHPAYKIEWWYYTGNLDAADGRRLGFQLTFFRVGVDPRPANPSRWAVRDLHMAHFAVTDVTNGRFHFSDRLQREGAGWAGAATDRYAVWNGTWSARAEADGSHRLQASDKGVAIDLTVRDTTRWVAHGRNGYSQKGRDPGNASHYYSLTRLPTRGTVTLAGEPMAVTGLSWMDHEFGTSLLEPGQLGWDWFALQLEDGRDLMLYQMRRRDGSRDPYSSGTIVSRDGAITRLAEGDYTLEALEHWRSPQTMTNYPTRWRVTIPGQRLTLDVRAALPASELHTPRSTGVTYWEGAVDITGVEGASSRPVRGRGYMELTGYAGAPLSESLR